MKHILLTCGAGDFIAMESYMTEKEKNDVEVIHWATRARHLVKELVPFVFKNVREHVIERDNWGAPFSKEFCISSAKELPNLDPGVSDWGVIKSVAEVNAGTRHFSGSTFANTKLCDISHLQLPKQYLVLHPFSENAPTDARDLTERELNYIFRVFKKFDQQIVVVNKSQGKKEPFPGTIDLTNKLNLLEAIEVTKHASRFIGASSLFSVVASKILPAEQLFIKGHNNLKFNYSSYYYAPHRVHTIVTKDIVTLCYKRNLC